MHQSRHLYKNSCVNVDTSIFHKGLKVGTTQMSINICMDKQNILHAHKQVLLDVNTRYGVSDFENFMLGKRL